MPHANPSYTAWTGGRATPLTPGEFEVEYVAASADRTTLYFNSNQGDIDRRHVWRVAAAGGAPAAVSSGAGIEWAPVPTADGKAVAFLRSDGRKPPRPAVQIGGGRARDLAPQAGHESKETTSAESTWLATFSLLISIPRRQHRRRRAS